MNTKPQYGAILNLLRYDHRLQKLHTAIYTSRFDTTIRVETTCTRHALQMMFAISAIGGTAGISVEFDIRDKRHTPRVAIRPDSVQNVTITAKTAEDSVPQTAQFNTTPATPDATAALVGAPLSASADVGTASMPSVALDPTYYLEQAFQWTGQSMTFTFLVQKYNAERNAFLLYPVGGCTGSFYRDAAFVYARCIPADEPVIREPLEDVMPSVRRVAASFFAPKAEV